MVLSINGIDMLPYIARQGLKWSRNDIDGPNAGRSSMDGSMIRDRVSVKARLDITCRPLTSSEKKIVFQAIYPEFVTVTYTDPISDETVTKMMYSNNISASFLMRKSDGTEWWSGITFPLIER